jgi:tetratricopeptide (TPR) repeat protein
MGLLKAALIASGAKRGKKLTFYLSLWEELYHQVLPHIPSRGDEEMANALFEWLWQTKPWRYKSRGSFRLTEVIQAQLDPSKQEVGNCLGLTLLFNTLAQGLGLKVGALYLERAFDRGPHILSVLYTPRGLIHVENILPSGFNYQGHLHLPQQEWGDKELLAEIYLSVGNEFFEQGKWGEAVVNYDKALKLNPHSQKAHLNKLMAQSQLKG